MHGKRMRLYGSTDERLRGPAHNRSTPESFWARVRGPRVDECWEWPGSRDDAGYGHVGYQGVQWRTHRLAFFLSHGWLPDPEIDGMVCHTCDNPPCCNPAHLYGGDRVTNTVDMYSRGRGNRATGVAHHMVQYTEEQARAMAAAFNALYVFPSGRRGRGKVTAIAETYGVSVDTVRECARRYPAE